MNEYSRKLYDTEAKTREMVADLIERDTLEAFEQYTRILASMTGQRVFEDWPPSERLFVYLAHPPITPDGQPPPDIEGVYPQWTALAAEFPAYYNQLGADAGKLLRQWEKGDLEPTIPAGAMLEPKPAAAPALPEGNPANAAPASPDNNAPVAPSYPA